MNDLRAVLTVVMFVAFLAIVFWAYSARRKSAFDAAARSILEEHDGLNKTKRSGGKQ
ncbi:MAG: CcoQ/FixQ family Cbb3-type cytochrome c oxidase assembly chaperone [Burkholderiales bacterium]